MANFSDLIEYFKNIARNHVDIGHSDSEKHFFRMEIEEVLGGINRSDVAYPLLILEGYSFSLSDNKSDNLLKDRSGAFILLDHVPDPSDFDKIHENWDHLEEIGTDIAIRLKHDKQSRLIPVIRDFDFDSLDASLIMNEVGNDIGIRFTYNIISPLANDVDPDKWIDTDG